MGIQSNNIKKQSESVWDETIDENTKKKLTEIDKHLKMKSIILCSRI